MALIWLARVWAGGVLASTVTQVYYALHDVYAMRAQAALCSSDSLVALTMRKTCLEARHVEGEPLLRSVLARASSKIEWCGPFPCRSIPDRDWSLYVVIFVLLIVVALLLWFMRYLVLRKESKRVQRQMQGGAAVKNM